MFRVRAGTVDLDRRVVSRDGGTVELTPIEVSALRRLLVGEGRVVSREDLLHDVWGYARASRSQAVHVAIRRLRAKLEVDPGSPDHLKTVAGVGWVLEVIPVAAAPGHDLVGRDALLALVRERVSENPLVVLLGPGGIGKTSLARAMGGRFVDLSAATDALGLAATLRRALDTDDPDAVVPTAGLVVLDNLEQVADAAAALLARWVAAGAKLLVTSRVRPRVRGAHVVEVGPLSLPDAAELFVRRAAAAGAPHRADDPDVQALVAGLEANPLCIELAAPRARFLSPRELLARLEDRFAVLRADEAGRPDRHRALDASLEVSWQLLADEDRRALADLAVFRGGFAPAAAEAVLGAHGLDHLQALTDASLLHRRGDRLDLYVSVRAWVERTRPASEGAVERHARWFARSFDATEVPNVLAAAERALAAGWGDVACTLVHVLGGVARTVPVPELGALVERALPHAVGADRPRLLRHGAFVHVRAGRPEEALAVLAEATGDPLQDGLCRELEGLVLGRLGRLVEARERLILAAAAFDAAGVAENRASVRVNLASLARTEGRLDDAERWVAEAFALYRDRNEPRGQASALGVLAGVCFDRGDLRGAERHTRDCIAAFERLGDAVSAATCRTNLAVLRCELDAGDAEPMARQVLADPATDLRSRARALDVLGRVALGCSDLDAARRHLGEALDEAHRSGDVATRAMVQVHLASVLRRQDDPAGAAALLDAAIPVLRAPGHARVLAAALRERST